jgi:hypothetical protein
MKNTILSVLFLSTIVGACSEKIFDDRLRPGGLCELLEATPGTARLVFLIALRLPDNYHPGDPLSPQAKAVSRADLDHLFTTYDLRSIVDSTERISPPEEQWFWYGVRGLRRAVDSLVQEPYVRTIAFSDSPTVNSVGIKRVQRFHGIRHQGHIYDLRGIRR